MKVHFYDAGQGLSALVMLPDGRHVLVDAGESPVRKGCGDACDAWHKHVMEAIGADLDRAGKTRLDLVWITHPHSDHLGGVPDVLAKFGARMYVDNGRDLEKPTVKSARMAAASASSIVRVIDPEHAQLPLEGTGTVKLTPIVPKHWPSSCATDANACSIGLRVDYCRSSVLFTGDAPAAEEDELDTLGEVTLLQVGHHGSTTSTGDAFIARIKPRYAVISAAKPEEGTNDGYCHPRSRVVTALTKATGGPGSKTLKAFDGEVHCEQGVPKKAHWVDVPASDHLWATERDGDVLLSTTGDGLFVREDAKIVTGWEP
jgi:competence protein ComEC